MFSAGSPKLSASSWGSSVLWLLCPMSGDGTSGMLLPGELWPRCVLPHLPTGQASQRRLKGNTDVDSEPTAFSSLPDIEHGHSWAPRLTGMNSPPPHSLSQCHDSACHSGLGHGLQTPGQDSCHGTTACQRRERKEEGRKKTGREEGKRGRQAEHFLRKQSGGRDHLVALRRAVAVESPCRHPVC